MNLSPPSKIEGATGSQVLSCSAFGNINEMSGSFQSATKGPLAWKTFRNGNLFRIEATVTESDTYICTIRNLKEQVQAFSIVKFFSCKKLRPRQSFLCINIRISSVY